LRLRVRRQRPRFRNVRDSVWRLGRALLDASGRVRVVATVSYQVGRRERHVSDESIERTVPTLRE